MCEEATLRSVEPAPHEAQQSAVDGRVLGAPFRACRAEVDLAVPPQTPPQLVPEDVARHDDEVARGIALKAVYPLCHAGERLLDSVLRVAAVVEHGEADRVDAVVLCRVQGFRVPAGNGPRFGRHDGSLPRDATVGRALLIITGMSHTSEWLEVVHQR